MLNDHCHIYLTTNVNAEANEFHIKMGGWDATPYIPVVIDRSLDGTLHYSTNLDGTSVPIVKNNHQMTLILTTAELNNLRLLVGRDCYFIPLEHAAPGDDHTGDRYAVVIYLKPGSVTNIDPGCQYWQAAIAIEDAS